MKVNSELEFFIKYNYSGSIINFEEDINRFMVLKRLFKKQALKNIIIDSDKHLLTSVNHVRIILNCFSLHVANKIFVFILEPNELIVWYSYIYALEYSSISYNKELELLLKPLFKGISYV